MSRYLYLLLLASIALLPCPVMSQASAPSAPAAQNNTSQNQPEITSRDEPTTFKVKVNLVEVRVVVRDAKGHALGNLEQQDFQLFDNGKPQTISKFSVEKAGAAPVVHVENGASGAPEPAHDTLALVPRRYIAYLFDDMHLEVKDLPVARNAAVRQLQAMEAGDRAAIFTTSGQTQLDFTDNRAQLIATLDRIIPRPLDQNAITACPKVSFYMADLIQNQHDEKALYAATIDALHCAFSDDSTKTASAQQMALASALEALDKGDEETRISLQVLHNVVRRMAGMPGERTIILVSPGFLRPDARREESELMESALHSNVVINTLDARGLYTDLPDVSEQRPPGAQIAGYIQQFNTQESQADEDVLAELADTTGGTFFHHNNDLGEGFQRLASPPEYSYLLGFAPQNLKLDGNYHKLKVTLKPPAEGKVQARKGYYAPRTSTDPSEQARQAIEDAVFSRDEIRAIPVELHTQFFKAAENSAQLSVLVRMDVQHIRFHKMNGRNDNDVTVVSALFDRNGNFVTGNQKVLQLRLKDDTLQGHLGSGITLKSSFDVKPGSYLVRLVVRDQDGELAAQNTAVEIPQ